MAPAAQGLIRPRLAGGHFDKEQRQSRPQSTTDVVQCLVDADKRLPTIVFEDLPAGHQMASISSFVCAAQTFAFRCPPMVI